MSTTPTLYIVHPGTGTIIAADECVIVRSRDYDQLESDVGSGAIGPESGYTVPDPFFVLSFSPGAIREHYESYDSGEPPPTAAAVAALDDAALREIADHALIDDRLYIAFHEILDTAVEDFTDADGN